MDQQFRSRFLRGSASSGTGTLVMLGVHFLSLKLLTAHMPVEAFGIFAVLTVICRGFEVLSGLGLNLTLVKHISGEFDREQNQRVVTTIVVMLAGHLILLSALVFAVGQLVLPWMFGTEIHDFVIFLPAMFCLGSIRDLLFAVLQGRQRFYLHATIKVLSATIRLGAIGLLTYVDRLSVGGLVGVEIITSVTTVTMLALCCSLPSLIRLTMIRSDVLRQILGFSAPLYIDNIFRYAYNRISLLLLAALLTPSSVAVYTIATTIPDALGRVLVSVLVVYFPSMSQLLGTRRHNEACRLMNLSLTLASVTLSFGALFTFFYQKEIVILLFSTQYVAAAPILGLLMFSFLLNCMSQLMGSTIVASGNSAAPVRINLATSVVSAVGCVTLIPYAGLYGAAYSQITANLMAQVLYCFQLRKSGFGADVRQMATPVALAAATIALYLTVSVHPFLLRPSLLAAFTGLCWLWLPMVRNTATYTTRAFSRLRFASRTVPTLDERQHAQCLLDGPTNEAVSSSSIGHPTPHERF